MNISWLGTGTSILGSFLVAFGFLLLGFSLFMVGAASWLWIGYKQNNRPMIVLNLFFLCANIIGLVRAI